MVSVAAPVRFSCPEVATSAPAQKFSWEIGVPANAFWDSIEWSTAANFLQNFSDTELAELPIDPNSTASTSDKKTLLISFLDAKLAKAEAAAAPKSLEETQPKVWRKLVWATFALQSGQGLTAEAGQNIRKLVAHFGDSDLVLQPAMAGQLVEEGDYIGGEKAMRTAVTSMDNAMNKASPHAIGSRRSLLSILWKQGPSRRADAEAVLAEIKESIQGMVGTQYDVYVKEEEEELDRLLAKLAK